jgi:serine protease Do
VFDEGSFDRTSRPPPGVLAERVGERGEVFAVADDLPVEPVGDLPLALPFVEGDFAVERRVGGRARPKNWTRGGAGAGLAGAAKISEPPSARARARGWKILSLEVLSSMNRKALLPLAALFVLAPSTQASARQSAPPAQSPAPAPSIVQAPSSPGAYVSTFFSADNFLGVVVEEVTRENMGRYGLAGGEPRGVGVQSVVKGSPAERAGLRERDVIVRFDGEAVTSVRKLNRLIDESSPEHTARLTLLRGGSEQQLSATLGKQEGFAPAIGQNFMQGFDSNAARELAERYKGDSGLTKQRAEELRRSGEEVRKRMEELWRNNPGGNPGGGNLFGFVEGRRIGITSTSLGPQLAGYFGVQKGVLVNSVVDGSPAARAGIKAGDVIVEAAGEQVSDSDDLTRALNKQREGEVTLSVYRDRKQRTVRVTPERRQPQSFQFSPGQFYRIPPVATIAPRAPRAAQAPRAPIAPRVVVPPVRALRGTGRLM